MTERTYIADLTTDELQELIEVTVQRAMALANPTYVKGVPGLMRIFQCSESTAKRIKKSGSIDKAISQQGRTFITNVGLACQLYGQQKKKRTTL